MCTRAYVYRSIHEFAVSIDLYIDRFVSLFFVCVFIFLRAWGCLTLFWLPRCLESRVEGRQWSPKRPSAHSRSSFLGFSLSFCLKPREANPTYGKADLYSAATTKYSVLHVQKGWFNRGLGLLDPLIFLLQKLGNCSPPKKLPWHMPLQWPSPH